ncbi:MAG: hypothetical protein RL215_2003, partial [Planctomycetota bacterium]
VLRLGGGVILEDGAVDAADLFGHEFMAEDLAAAIASGESESVSEFGL